MSFILRLTNVVFWLVVGWSLYDAWQCHQGGGCYRMTKRDYTENIRQTVEATWEACKK